MNEEIIIHQEELDRQPSPRRPRNWRWLKWVLGLLFALGIGAVVFVLLNLFKVSTNPFGFGHLKGESDGRVNIMMLGVGDPGHDGENLSDTNLILSVDTVNHKVAVISIPRDLRVRIPSYGQSKINNANAQLGVKGAKSVFEDNFGVPIHYYVKANFTGLKQVVDAVGGVDVKNDYALIDTEYPCDKNQYKSCGFKLAAGQHHLDGATALKYVRCRKGTCGDDFGRAERQQEVMQSIRARATSAGTLANPVALAKLIAAAGSNVQTDLSVNNLLRLNDLTKPKDGGQINPINIVFNLNPDGFLVASNDSSDLLPASGSFTKIQDFVKDIFKFGPIWAEHPTVLIENGTTTPGTAGKLQKQLRDDGYNLNVIGVINATTSDHATTLIIDHTSGQRSNTINYLQGLLKVQATPPASPVKVPPADIVIIIGNDFVNATAKPTTQR